MGKGTRESLSLQESSSEPGEFRTCRKVRLRNHKRETNSVVIPREEGGFLESRMRLKVHVRFGGGSAETYQRPQEKTEWPTANRPLPGSGNAPYSYPTG